MNRTMSAVLAAMLLAGPVFAWSAGKKGADAPPGKPYVYKQSGGAPREMEIYFPPNHDPAKAHVPGVILFHGGAWTGGTLSQFRNACGYFASRGLVAATVNYRMLSKPDAARLDEAAERPAAP